MSEMMEIVECKSVNNDIEKLRLAKVLSQRIRSVLSELSEELDDIRAAISINSELVVTSAEHMNASLFAPVKWQPGWPLYGSEPPAPQPDAMRAGVLGKSHASFEVNHSSNTADVIDIAARANHTVLAEQTPVKVASPIEMREAKPQIAPRQQELLPSVIPKTEVKYNSDTNPAPKRSRTININFGFSDSEDSD